MNIIVKRDKNIFEVIRLNNNKSNTDIPLGLGMALAQNVNAMNYFSSLSKERQNDIINQAHRVNSKREMKALVSSLEVKASELF